MPCRNSEATIVSSILSIKAQTMTDWELIVVDDASTDHTTDIVRKLAKADERISLESSVSNLGTGKARSLGVRKARAKKIAFLDSDDLWLPEKLDRDLAFMESHGAHWIHSAYRFLRPDGHLSAPVTSKPVGTVRDLLGPNPITLSTVMLDRSIYPDGLSFHFERAQDLELWIALAKEKAQCLFSDSPDVIYRLRTGSLSSNKLLAAMRRHRNLRTLTVGPWTTSISFVRYIFGSSAKFLRRFRPCEDCQETETYIARIEKQAQKLLVSK